MTSHATVHPDPDVVYTRFDESSAALLHLKTKRYYTLNVTGATIWELMARGEGSRTIAAALHDVYDIELDAAEAYVIELLDDLRKEGLVTG
jgi:hypothetical protein